MSWEPNQSHYLHTELTRPYAIPLIPNARLGSDKYLFYKSLVWLDCEPNSQSPAHEACALPNRPPHPVVKRYLNWCVRDAILLATPKYLIKHEYFLEIPLAGQQFFLLFISLVKIANGSKDDIVLAPAQQWLAVGLPVCTQTQVVQATGAAAGVSEDCGVTRYWHSIKQY